MPINRSALLLAIVLVYAASFRFLTLNRPFSYDAEGSGCLNGVLARNYLRFDWAQSHGIPVLSSGSAGTATVVLYPDHPPMLPLLIAPFYAAFGVGAWQTRLPISIITVFAIFTLYRILARFATPRVGLVVAAMFAATPMTLYFGGFPDVVGMPLILFVLLTVIAYLQFHGAPSPGTFARLVGAFLLAGLCDWPTYVIVPILLVHFVATRPRREWSWIVAFAFTACALFVAIYVYITLATGYRWTWMAPLFSRRSAIVGQSSFTLRQWLGVATDFNRTYHTLPLVTAAGFWLTSFAWRLRPAQPGATVARLLLAWGGLYMLLGSKALFDHEWAWVPLTPGLAVAAALLIDWMLRTLERLGIQTISLWVVALLLVAFASYTGYTTFIDLYPLEPSHPYTPMEMGEAIQAAAPDARDVALLFGDDASAQLWFYGDRALRTNIWSVDDFQRRLKDDNVDLMFNFDEQPWQATATGFVFPRGSEQDFAVLRRYLSERYPLVPLPPALASKFDIFDLRNPLAE